MEFYGGLSFFLLLMLILIPAIILGIMEKNLRYYTLLASVIVIGMVFWDKPVSGFYLILYSIIELFLVKGYLYLRKRYGRKAWIYRSAVVLSIVPLLLCKVSEVQGLMQIRLFAFIGISYLTFRVIQIIIETYDGVITELKIIDFMNFLLFFPTFSCGPIDRSRRFEKDSLTTYKRSEYLDLVGDGLQKLLTGIVYKFVIAALIHRVLELVDADLNFISNLEYAYLYGSYMFFDFAGYSLMAVGTGAFFGIRVPMNFDRPFSSIDIKDFWNRWHITLSQWFRDFLFSRFVMLGFQKKWFKDRLYAAVLGFMINMTVMGIWHGLSIHYIIYGLYHGVLLGLTEIYQKKSKFYKKYKKKQWYRIISWFITLQLVMFGFLIFSGRIL